MDRGLVDLWHDAAVLGGTRRSKAGRAGPGRLLGGVLLTSLWLVACGGDETQREIDAGAADETAATAPTDESGVPPTTGFPVQTITMPEPEEGGGAGAPCALLTPADFAEVFDGAEYGSRDVDTGEDVLTCQWLGPEGTTNVYLAPTGEGASAFDAYESEWTARGDPVEELDAPGDRAIALDRPGNPIRFVVVQVGDESFAIQSTASIDQLVALATAASERL
jgi:hypothetical protein